jgi:hypothetical protein
VQAAISLSDKIEELGRRALLWFHEYSLDLPVKRTNGETVWWRTCYAILHKVIENPIHGGVEQARRWDTWPMASAGRFAAWRAADVRLEVQT